MHPLSTRIRAAAASLVAVAGLIVTAIPASAATYDATSNPPMFMFGQQSGAYNTCVAGNMFPAILVSNVLTTVSQIDADSSSGPTLKLLNWYHGDQGGFGNGCHEIKVYFRDSAQANLSSHTVPTGVATLNVTIPQAAVEVYVTVQPISGPGAAVYTMGTSGGVIPIVWSGGAAAGGAGAPAAVPATLTADGCNASSVNGVEGEWVTLATTCTASKTGSHLLGWSTSPTFPVEIAKRQAANKWGTYELTDASGAVTSVFIPAGWPVFLSGSNTLYPIWG